MTIGERIREKRIESGLTQEELSKKLGYKSRSSVNKMESARALPLKKVEMMSEVLGCSKSYLMGWEDQDVVCKVENNDVKMDIELLHGLNDDSIKRLKAYADILRKTQ